MQVNRSLKDKHFDWIDHALGRPVNPLRPSYRNYFAANAQGDIADHMATSPHWHENKSITCGQRIFNVTNAGRRALADHLKTIGDQHRLFTVEWDGMEMKQVAKSHSNALYLKWLSVSDSYDISFIDFASTARARLAQ